MHSCKEFLFLCQKQEVLFKRTFESSYCALRHVQITFKLRPICYILFSRSTHLYPRHFFLNVLGRKDLAIDMYKKGIEELEKGIAVEITGNGMYIWLMTCGKCYFTESVIL